MVALLLLAVAGIGVAGAQSGGSGSDTPYRRFVDRVAELLGKQPAEVRSAITEAQSELVDEAVREGRIPAGRADDIKERIAEGDGAWGGRIFGGHGHGHGHGFHIGGLRAQLDAATELLGLTREELLEQLRAGKSLAEIAGAEKTPQLIDTIVKSIQEQIDTAKASGDLTEARAARITENLRDRVTNLVNRNLPERGFREDRGPGHHGRSGGSGAESAPRGESTPAPTEEPQGESAPSATPSTP